MRRFCYRNIFLLTLFIAEINNASAQSQNSSGLTHYNNAQVFRLKAWTTMSKKEWNDVIYRFPEFQNGKIILKEGTSPTDSPALNYNIHQEKIVFVSGGSDTTDLKYSSQVKSFRVGDHVFLSNSPKGFVEKMNQTPVALGARPLLKVMFESNNGERFAGTDWNMPTSRLDRLYIKQEEYYFIDKHEATYRATLPSILKIYKSSKKEVKRYVKKNKIDFNKKDHLLQLLDFCKTYEASI